MSSLAQVLQMLDDLGRVADLRVAAKPVGDWFAKREQAIISSGGTAGGHEEFVPLARSTIRRKERIGQPRKPLVASGAMLRDFAAGGAIEASNERLVLGPARGSSHDYAFWNIKREPKRDPTPSMTPAERTKVVQIIADAIRDAIRERVR